MDGSLTAVRVALARCRRRGLPFSEAWSVALDLGCAVAADDELPATFDVLTSTWPVWLAAYQRAPSRIAELSS